MLAIPPIENRVLQTANALKQSILSGQFSGSLPGERSLASMLSVSRKTMRKAIDLLEQEGWTNESVAIKQTGDEKVRLLLNSGATNTGGASFDDIIVNDFVAVPEPSTTALLGLGGLALILRRRK
ncbi:GntR family transcriptional regulator [Rubritalea tangerina]|uniref:GntR family transcriptional regulator n=1 Tax=Rubritalea tangerina TaxID=430798 RepID=A0ABW4Z6Z0_9BACT